MLAASNLAADDALRQLQWPPRTLTPRPRRVRSRCGARSSECARFGIASKASMMAPLMTWRHFTCEGCAFSRGVWQQMYLRFGGGGRLRHAQRGGYATDYLPIQEHPEMADTIEGDGFHLGVRGH
jgi:hypothetical protein